VLAALKHHLSAAYSSLNTLLDNSLPHNPHHSGTMQQPYKQEVMKKEFLAAMRAKGKLPRFVTEASESFVSG
jgi:hypothetical protein